MDIKTKFGSRIRYLRLKKKLSQETLANLAQLDRTYIPSIEKGERNVSIEVIKKLAFALECSISELFNGID
jgi:transcriptional regulator with XRE-family HTH domain